MRNSNLVYVPKMEYVHKVNIFGLKMMVKSGLEKNIFTAKNNAKNCKFSNKNDLLCAWRDFNKKILDHFSPSFLGQKY